MLGMARPKEKESEATNLKLEVAAKAKLNELAWHYKTSRTKVVEVLVNERHDQLFSSRRKDGSREDPVRELAGRLLSAGFASLHPSLQHGDEAEQPTTRATEPKPGTRARTTPRPSASNHK